MAGSSREEEKVRLPLALLASSAGFAFDLGGSALKLLYRSKEDFKNGKPLKESEDGKGPLRLALYARENIEGLIEHVKEHCDVTDANDGTIYSAGMGGNCFKDLLEGRLNIKLKNLPEFPCLDTGLAWMLENLSVSQVFHPLPEEAKPIAKKRYMDFCLLAGSVESFGGGFGLEDVFTENADTTISYPFMVVLCGSAFLMFKVNESGPPDFLEALPMGGRFYLGAMRLMTGVTDHNKLVDMMTSSDGRSVDMYTTEMTSQGTDDSYSHFNDHDINLFPFGKANYQPRDKIKDGDVVNSFTRVMCVNLVQMCCLTAQKAGLKKAYFCGNFVNSEFIKTEILSEIYSRNAISPKEDRLYIQFLQYGGHLGALGAFLKQTQGQDA